MKELQCKELVQTYDKEDIKNLWKKIQNNEDTPFEKGKALEYLIIRAFELDGAEVEYPYSIRKNGVQVEQIDGLIHFEYLSCLIECKDHSDNVNVEPLAKMRSQLLRRPSSTIGSIFSINGFTQPAIILASYMAPQTILLWEQTEIDYVINEGNIADSLKEKYRMCIKECICDFNTKPLLS
jgi:hypothetical protein